MKSSSSILIWVGLVIIASVGLYRTSNRVNQLTHNLTQLNASIESERQSIHVLKADWVYLANPERIAGAAKRHLTLRPTAPEQIAGINDLGNVLPAAQPAVTPIGGTPMANIKTTLKTRLATVIDHVHAATIRVAALHKPVLPKTIASVQTPAETPTLLASNDTNTDIAHINDTMLIQHNASVSPSSDSIGNMINGLDSRP